MRHGHRFTLVAASAIASVSLLCGAAAAGAAAPGPGAAGAASTAPAEVRVNQAGYATSSPKVAFVMLPRKVGQVSFTVFGRHGPRCPVAAPPGRSAARVSAGSGRR